MRISLIPSALCLAALLAQPAWGQDGAVLVQEWQTNSPALSIDFNGVATDGITSAAYGLFIGTNSLCPVAASPTFNLATNLIGSVHEVAISAEAPKPGSSNFVFGTGEIVNVDIFQPVTWLWGGATPFWWPFYLGNLGNQTTFGYSDPLSLGGGPIKTTLQGVAIDASAASGFVLSQAAALDITMLTNPGGTPLVGLGDDNSVAVPLVAPVTFYGTSYSTLYVESNGRVMFVAGSGDFSPTVGDILLQNPSVGYFTDLSPNIAGAVSVLEVANTVAVSYDCVPYFSEGTNLNSYYVAFDIVTGDVTLGNLRGIRRPNAANEGALCLSNGNVGPATDAGATLFVAGTSGSHPLATDAYYDGHFNTAVNGFTPTLDPNVNAAVPNTIVFSPDGLGGYGWTAN
ncbi:MAG TPA: hypothetical protein PKA37_14220 [Planctomycetota bacterium]|nr:hypothetical protein [Planctomycetota bacterium]